MQKSEPHLAEDEERHALPWRHYLEEEGSRAAADFLIFVNTPLSTKGVDLLYIESLKPMYAGEVAIAAEPPKLKQGLFGNIHERISHAHHNEVYNLTDTSSLDLFLSGVGTEYVDLFSDALFRIPSENLLEFFRSNESLGAGHGEPSVSEDTESSDWSASIDELLSELASDAQGENITISESVLDAARTVLESLRAAGAPEPDVGPVEDETVSIDYQNLGKRSSVAVIVEPDGTLFVHIVAPDGKMRGVFTETGNKFLDFTMDGLRSLEPA